VKDTVFRVEECRQRRGKRGGWSRWIVIVEVPRGAPPSKEPSYGDFDDHTEACRHATSVVLSNRQYARRKDEFLTTYYLSREDQARENARLARLRAQRWEAQNRRGVAESPLLEEAEGTVNETVRRNPWLP
jgi:post-segregation antitoxin (ccd killing protein)